MRLPSCLLALVACSSAAMPPPANQASSQPAKPPAIAVQLAYRGTFMSGPPFTPSCPSIDPALLHLDAGATMGAVVLEGAELSSVLAIAPANRGRFIACAGNIRFQLTLVPGVPGSDLSAELASYRPRRP